MFQIRHRPVFQSADEHVQEVDEGEFNKGAEDWHEANDDEDVQSCGVANLRFSFASKADGDDSEYCGGS